MNRKQSKDSVPRLDSEQQKVVEWLRSDAGIKWSASRIRPLESQAHREGQMFTLEPERNFLTANYYTPWTDEDIEWFTAHGTWIYEPDTVKGLSSPA